MRMKTANGIDWLALSRLTDDYKKGCAENSPYLNLKVSPSSTALPGVISKIPLKG